MKRNRNPERRARRIAARRTALSEPAAGYSADDAMTDIARLAPWLDATRERTGALADCANCGRSLANGAETHFGGGRTSTQPCVHFVASMCPACAARAQQMGTIAGLTRASQGVLPIPDTEDGRLDLVRTSRQLVLCEIQDAGVKLPLAFRLLRKDSRLLASAVLQPEKAALLVWKGGDKATRNAIAPFTWRQDEGLIVHGRVAADAVALARAIERGAMDALEVAAERIWGASADPLLHAQLTLNAARWGKP